MVVLDTLRPEGTEILKKSKLLKALSNRPYTFNFTDLRHEDYVYFYFMLSFALLNTKPIRYAHYPAIACLCHSLTQSIAGSVLLAGISPC